MYYYRVRAHRENDGFFSAYSHLSSAQTDACTPPAGPTDLAATAFSQSQIDLAWTDNAKDETAYHVERLPNGTTGWIEIVALPADTTAYSDMSLDCGTSYLYRVRAYREVDQTHSLYSTTADAMTQLCPLPAPSSLTASTI